MDSTICADIKASVHRAPEALCPRRCYSWNFVVTGANEPYRMENFAVSERPSPVLGKPFLTTPIVAAVCCHWQQPEAWPAREQAVDRWLQQSARFGDRQTRRLATRYRWPDEVPAVPLPLPCRRSLVRIPSEWKQRGNPRRKPELRIIDLWRRNACGGGLPLLWRYAAERMTPHPYLHGEPLPGRRHPVKAASREAGARDARQP